VRVTDAPGDTRRGGGIFLHVDNGNKTAGCIAVKRSVMRSLMTWLDPEESPVIVIEVD
jgi:L,D-peptidoglycan transpeptidase YkuD (ErfK/YbiS/YcfS/YnhG family)